ncbi:hypothetical protein B1H10_05280 [candidate division KSB1 bacterium 4484_188]|nr:MAG: hypothetical protein B1H10_05280 [candidate division KSB1 bacterium 4484_188]
MLFLQLEQIKTPAGHRAGNLNTPAWFSKQKFAYLLVSCLNCSARQKMARGETNTFFYLGRSFVYLENMLIRSGISAYLSK